MGLSNKTSKSSQVQDTTSHATTTPDVPAWLQSQTQAFNSRIGDLAKIDPYSLVPQSNGLQRGAQDIAQGLRTSGSAGLLNLANTTADQVSRSAAPTVGAQSVLDGLDRYYTPFRDQVLNPVMNDFDHNAALTRAAQAAGGARGAFGGSRYGVREAATEDNLARARASTEGGLLDRLYTQATGLSGEDANRRQSADATNAGLTMQQRGLALNGAGMLAQNALSADANQRSNAGLLSGLGDQQYQIDANTAQAPYTQQRTLEGLLQGLNPSMFVGQTTDGTGHTTGTSSSSSEGSWMDSLGKGLQTAAAAAALFSDERLKTEIEPVGKDRKGRTVYDYEYLWEPGQKRRGYMAQELLRTDPQAVKSGPRGFLMVDYGAVS